jgi:1-acyl-sn-glycerol-3-phosphate acyltransferase
MRGVVGAVRMALAVISVTIGSIFVVWAGWLPWRVRGVALGAWIVVGLARLLCRVLRVRVHCANPTLLSDHRGFVFPNHSSLLDILALLAVAPMRFVSAVEVAKYPVLGQITKSIGTVFVARHDRDARKQARGEIATALLAYPRPPIVLFPEGRLGPGHAMYPFRFGAFDVAAQAGIPYVPCGLRYRPLEVTVWHGGQGEELWGALWRLATHGGPIRAEVLPLPLVTPTPLDDPAKLARDAQTAIAQALGIPTEPMTPPPPRFGELPSA